ncbi:MAG: hypothetical protein ACTSO2_20275 [Promethearchaeota archaeon]
MKTLYCSNCQKEVNFIEAKQEFEKETLYNYFCKECGEIIGSNSVLKEFVDNSKEDIYDTVDKIQVGDLVYLKSDYSFGISGKVREVLDNEIIVDWDPSDISIPEKIAKNLVYKVEARYKTPKTAELQKYQQIQKQFKIRENVYKTLDEILNRVNLRPISLDYKRKKSRFIISQACVGSKVRKLASFSEGIVESIIKDGIYKVRWNDNSAGIYFAPELDLLTI